MASTEIVQHAFGNHAEQLAHLRIGDGVAAVGDCLLEKRKAVAQAAFGGTRQDSHCARLDRQFFFARDAFDLFADLLE